MDPFQQHNIPEIFTILLRVPTLFLIDAISNSKFCVSLDAWQNVTKFLNFLFLLPTFTNSNSLINHLPGLTAFASLAFTITGCGFAFGIFLLRPYEIFKLYLIIASLGAVGWSYVLNVEYQKYCSDFLLEHSSLQNELFNLNKKALQVFIYNYILQSLLSIVFCLSIFNLPHFNRKKYLVGVLFIFPVIVNAALPSSVLTIVSDLVAIVTLSIALGHFVTYIVKLLNYVWLHTPWSRAMSWIFDIEAISNCIRCFWAHFRVPQVLQLFFVIKFVKILVLIVNDFQSSDYNDLISFSFSNQLFHVLEIITILSFENLLSISGIAQVLALIVNTTIYIPVLTFLNFPDNEQQGMPFIFSHLLLIWSVQFGVSNIEPEKRFDMVLNICYMMGVSVLSSINRELCRKLKVLGLTGDISFKKHVRALIVAFFIFVVSISWLIIIFKSYIVWDSVLFSVATFIIETLIILLISLIIYTLNLIHYHFCTMWYELYDYTYYLESTRNVLNVILSVMVFLKGLYNMFEHRSIIRVIFLLFHFYYNIWEKVVLGWNYLRMRHSIYSCVKSLPIATTEEVVEMGGVCAICLNNVTRHIVCITRCNHYFHSYCLQKWLWERKTCPICHRIIFAYNNQIGEIQRLHFHED